MRSYFILFITLISALASQGQNAGTYWIFFRDKGPDAASRLMHPETLLSPLALEKRAARGITPDAYDLPVEKQYVDALMGGGIQVIGCSRWLNAALIQSGNSPDEILKEFSFVQRIRIPRTHAKAAEWNPVSENKGTERERALDMGAISDFGQASQQAGMMNVPELHKKGFTGNGVVVAIMDAGFAGADTNPAFHSLWKKNRVLSTWDFVESEKNVFDDNDHGLHVLSCIGAWIPGEMIGTGPGASFLLGRTETTASESRQEELNWLKGMEWADSMGADVLHSSLGYSTFDDESEDYSYDSLDGKTSLITRAAKIAVSRGLLVTTSAGNEGFTTWHYITAPCDCEGVLCIGSVDREGKLSYFSSVGPTFDGRIKPDVVAMGSRTAVMGTNGKVIRSDGTSYSAPLVAGLAACLVQAHPSRKGAEIIDAIRRSGNNSANPNNKFGFGVPDALRADSLLNEMDIQSLAKENPDDPAAHYRIERLAPSGHTQIRPLSERYTISKVITYSQKGEVVNEMQVNGKRTVVLPPVWKDGSKAGYLEIQLEGGASFRVSLQNTH